MSKEPKTLDQLKQDRIQKIQKFNKSFKQWVDTLTASIHAKTDFKLSSTSNSTQANDETELTSSAFMAFYGPNGSKVYVQLEAWEFTLTDENDVEFLRIADPLDVMLYTLEPLVTQLIQARLHSHR